MKPYIAGPMRGLPEFNFPAFFRMEGRLRRLGMEPWNPARFDVMELGFDYRGRSGKEDLAELGFPLDVAIERDLQAIREECNAVICLPGWRNSVGAQREIDLAWTLGYPVFEEALIA